MSTIGLSFGVLGFILSIVAISQCAAATEKIQVLEKKLEQAGLGGSDDLDE